LGRVWKEIGALVEEVPCGSAGYGVKFPTTSAAAPSSLKMVPFGVSKRCCAMKNSRERWKESQFRVSEYNKRQAAD
jgi:hypothetical protein